MSSHVWMCRGCDGTGEFVDGQGEQCWVCKRCKGSGEQRREEVIGGEPLVPLRMITQIEQAMLKVQPPPRGWWLGL